jgi:hypothetical protein
MAVLPPNKGDRPKRHHVVAQSYLERFSIKKRVELVDRDDFTKSTPPMHVKKALAENYFYSLDLETGREPLGETFLANQVDTPGCDAIRRMFDERQPLGDHATRAALSIFLAFQHVRGRTTREALVEYTKLNMRVLGSFATPALVLERARAEGEDMTEEQAAETAEDLRTGRFDLVPAHPANVHLGSAFKTPTETVPFFYGRKWQVLEFDEPCLITSDEPVALIRDDPSTPGEGGGLPSVRRIVFPIDPRRALVMFRPDSSEAEGWLRGRPDDATMINRHVAFYGHSYIVRTPGTDPLKGLVVPEKAPPAFIVGTAVGIAPQVSKEARARFIAQIPKGRFGPEIG